VARVGVDVAQQTVGVGFFDILQALKLGDRLGLGGDKDVVERLHRSLYFSKLAQASVDFANTIGGVSLPKKISQLDQARIGAYCMLKGDALVNSRLQEWGCPDIGSPNPADCSS
jgi:hypothetical protein